MRIAVIAESLNTGGAERSAGYLSKYLSQYHTVFLFLRKTENRVYDYGGTIVDLGGNGYEELASSLFVAKEMYRIEVSISFNLEFNYANVASRCGDTVIVSERNYQSLCVPREFIYEQKNKYYFPMADHIVAVSEGVKKEILETTKVCDHNVSTVYNFFACDRVRKLASECNDEDVLPISFNGRKLIISVGRLHPQKDYIRLLIQFRTVYHCDQETRLVIIGAGTLQDELQEWINRLELQDMVVILPFRSNPFSLIVKASVFVLSSIHEGYPNVLLEAMALNVPVVSVDCPAGPREILDDETDYSIPTMGYRVAKRGLLVEQDHGDREGRTRHLADAILRVLQDKEMREDIIRSAMKWIKRRSNEEILKRWMGCINKAIENRGANNRFLLHTSKNTYVIYGAGYYGQRIYQRLQSDGREIQAFVVSDINDSVIEINGVPIYDRSWLLDHKNDVNIAFGILNRIYANEVIGWFIENHIDNVTFF